MKTEMLSYSSKDSHFIHCVTEQQRSLSVHHIIILVLFKLDMNCSKETKTKNNVFMPGNILVTLTRTHIKDPIKLWQAEMAGFQFSEADKAHWEGDAEL